MRFFELFGLSPDGGSGLSELFFLVSAAGCVLAFYIRQLRTNCSK